MNTLGPGETVVIVAFIVCVSITACGILSLLKERESVRNKSESYLYDRILKMESDVSFLLKNYWGESKEKKK